MILQGWGMHDHDFLGKLWGVQIPREFEVRGRNSLRFTRMQYSPKGWQNSTQVFQILGEDESPVTFHSGGLIPLANSIHPDHYRPD